jgi:hypothetical protein
MMTIWEIVLSIIVICTTVASIRLGLIGFQRFETRKVIAFITAPGWCFFAFIFLLWKIGDFARGESSPLPWVAFTESYLRHGLLNGLLSGAIVVIAELWLFWIPASLWIKKHSEADRTKQIMARAINLLSGALLTQVANPVYKFIIYIF